MNTAKAQTASSSITDIITSAANSYGVSASKMIRLSLCESGKNPLAWNKSDPYGGSIGLYQYLKPTWNYYSKQLGIDNPDIWNPQQQAELTAYLISIGKSDLWSCQKEHDIF